MGVRKALGVPLLLAVLVLAFSASAASAKEVHIEGTSAPFTVKGESTNIVYTFEGGNTVKCKKSSFAATVGAKAVGTLELFPTNSDCSGFGFSEATVDLSACADPFTFTLLATLQYEWALVYDIACLASKEATITAGTCEVTLGSQTGREEAGGFNLATSPKTIEVETDLAGLTYNKVKDGFLCPLSGTGEKSDGKQEGSFILKAFEGGTQRGIYVE